MACLVLTGHVTQGDQMFLGVTDFCMICLNAAALFSVRSVMCLGCWSYTQFLT